MGETGSFTLMVSGLGGASTPGQDSTSTDPALSQYAADHAGGPGAIYVGDVSQLAGPAPNNEALLADGDGLVPLEDLQNHLWLYESSYYRSLLDRANLTSPTPLTSSGQDIVIQFSCINRALAPCILVENWLAPNLETRTGGQLTLEVVSFRELGVAGPDSLQLVSDGTLDMTEIYGGYVGGELPLLDLQFLVGLYPDHETMLNSVVDTLPGLQQAIAGATQGGVTIHNNWYSGHDSYIFAHKPLRNVTDFNGLKTRSFSGALSDWLDGMGAEGLFLAFAEVYIALERGIVDAAVTNTYSAQSQRWYEVVDYMTGPLTNFFSSQNVINDEVWSDIPTDLQQILFEEGAKAELEAMRLAAVQNLEGVRRLVDVGMEVAPFSSDVKEQSFDVALVQHVIPAWLRSVGFPGSGDQTVQVFNQHVGPYVGLRIGSDGSVVKTEISKGPHSPAGQ